MCKLLRIGSKAFASNFKTLREPYKLIFAVTYRCNSKCKTCNIWQQKTENEMNLDEIKRFFNKNSFLWVNLTGGEVFIRDDIVEIVKSMRGIYLLNITTNGILTKRIIEDSEDIKNIVPKYVLTVSIDGPKKIHNEIRGVDCWDKALKTYRELKEIGIKSYIGYTFSPYNIDHFEETFDEIVRIIPDFTMKDLHINFYHESDIYFVNKGQIVLNNEYVEKLKERISYFAQYKKGLGMIPFLERRYLEHIEKYLDTGVSPLPCKALSSSCFLDPQGNVYPCTFLNTKLGNIKESDYGLKKIYNSKNVDRLREQIKNHKCPGCWTPCEAYQSILGNLI